MAIGSTAGSRILRLLIGLIVVAVILTVFGIIEVSKDLGGSHSDFSNMAVSDFRKGDILQGTITETLGCAVRYESTSRHGGKSYTYYYVIPYFQSLESDVPTKVMCYCTGNNQEHDLLEKLAEETIYMYVGETDSTTTRVTVDRAEVNEMSQTEYGYIRDYIRAFVDAFYDGYDTDYYFDAYMNALVPYVVRKNAATGSPFLMIGLGMLFVLGIIALVTIFASKRRMREPEYTYVSPEMNYNTNYNYRSTPIQQSSEPSFLHSDAPSSMQSPAGAPYDLSKMRPPVAPERTAPDPIPDFPVKRETDTLPPPVMPTVMPTSQMQQPQTHYRSSQAALEAVDMMISREKMKNSSSSRFKNSKPSSPEQILNMYGGQQQIYPSYHSAGFGQKVYQGVDDRPLPPLAGEEKSGAAGVSGTAVRPSIYEDEFSQYVPYSALHEHKQVSDTMPTVDPRSSEEVDLSNGGTESGGQVKPNVVTPHSNGIPIINPDLPERDTDESFDSRLDIPEMPKAPEIPRYTGEFPAQPAQFPTQPDHPIVSPYIQSSLPGAMPAAQAFPTPPPMPEATPAPVFEVLPTDPEMRNNYAVGGHLMEEVDPYTEKNVDLSNGGRELPED